MRGCLEPSDGQVIRRKPIHGQDIPPVKYEETLRDFQQWARNHSFELWAINIDYLRRDLKARRKCLRTGLMAAEDERFVIDRIPPASNSCHPNLRSLVAFALFNYPNFGHALIYCFCSLSRRTVLNLLYRVFNNTYRFDLKENF